MSNAMETMTNKWSLGFIAIASFSAASLLFVHVKSKNDYDKALENYRTRATIEARDNAKTIGDSLGYIYQGIRTISMLPSVKSIDRHGTRLDTNARESIVQIYNNMSSNVDVSEVYIVPVDFDPDATDAVTGKKQIPILMFDDKIAFEETATGKNHDEDESHEYAILQEQMAYLKQHYPNISPTERLNPPFISGAEVVTCDNSEYAKTLNDDDRKGVIFSVPFYGENGALKGTISAIIRSNVLKNMMPDTDHALINQTHQFIALSKKSGQQTVSETWVRQGKADPSLLYSAVIPVATSDPQSNWALWVGLPDNIFLESAEVKANRDFTLLGYSFIIFLACFGAGAWELQRRNFITMNQKIGSRTAELEQTIGLMGLLKSVATAANEADSIKEGFQIAINSICAYTGWTVGHAYIYSEEKQKLVSLDVWHLQEPARYETFKRVSEVTELANHEGFLGEVFADSTPMWVLDVVDSTVYTRKKAASEVGLKAAFGFPVFIGKKAVAVIEFYSPSAEIPDENLLSTMGNIGKQLGQIVERVDTIKNLKRSNLKMEAASRDLQESLAKAEEANKAKGDFLANMSHELRTPMNGVLGMASLLADTPLNEEQKEFVSTINGSGESLLMLLNDILDFSKIEAGALELENIAFNVGEVVQKTANLLRPQAGKKNIDLLVDCESNPPHYIWGDSGRIRQIITNLLGNAIKFTERGHVRLKVDLQEDDDQGSRLYVRVEDTGMGIPAHKIHEIFDKFTQGDASVTRKYGGTGLGLAITKHLVNLMGGDIGVESAEGKGSTFWFSIPCTLAEASDEITTIEQLRSITHSDITKMPIAKARALLVDDYHVNQVFAEKLLRKFGFQHIDKAEDGFEALLKCNENQYDIIFMDCQMPKMDGYITTEEIRLREFSGLTHLPIVAMTANAMMGDREKCLNAGMDDYLSKPLRAEHLRKILQTWFVLDEDKAAISPNAAVSITQENRESPVDMEQLRMFTDGDVAEEKALATLFLDQAAEMITILENSTGADKNDVWKSAAHRFKGSSGNLGAMKLHHLCKLAEMQFDDSETDKLEMLTCIKFEMERVGVFFEHIT